MAYAASIKSTPISNVSQIVLRKQYRNQLVVCNINKAYANNERILKEARLQFSEEVKFKKRDEEVSTVKALSLIYAEDEAFHRVNMDENKRAIIAEGGYSVEEEVDTLNMSSDDLTVVGNTMSMILTQFDFLEELVKDVLQISSKDNSYTPLEVLNSVSKVVKSQGYNEVKDKNPRNFYLPEVMTLRSGSGMLLSVIHKEVCTRLGLNLMVVGVGEQFLLWPEDSKEMLHILQGLEVNCLSNRGVLAAILSRLKNLHWRNASGHEPSLTERLHLSSKRTILKPIHLRLAVMASERLLLLQPGNWIWRRDHGLLLYYSRRYGEALQELSICTALAPSAEVEKLQQFVEKLHLLRLEDSWKLS